MNLIEFEEHLKKVRLDDYRKKYQPIKLVEMDLPKNIQALDPLYFFYWEKRTFYDYEDFYKTYHESYKELLEQFRIKITMCEDCFYRGLPARIYRTWASIVTQIHAGYAAESVFGDGSVEMSSDLDHSGVDFKVVYKGHILNYQVKKETQSREVRRAKTSRRQIEGEFLQIEYQVPAEEYFKNPKKLNGDYKEPYRRFISNENLKRLPNGFVVFTTKAFEGTKKEIDSMK